MEKIKLKIICLTILFIIAFDTFYFWVIKYNYNKEISLHLLEDTKQVDTKVKYAINTCDLVSETIFSQIINKPDVLEIFSKAYRADDSEKKEIRKELYLKLEETYKHLKALDIRQLHFHLPDNESFLRFHSPDNFGDNLTKDRYSVRMANRENKIYKGFEEGKINDGFRYVFPLEYNNKHIGTVETSFSVEKIKKQLNLFGVTYTSFILKKSLMMGTVFKDKQSFYKKSLISDNYVTEAKEINNIKEIENKIEKIDLSIKKNIDALLRKNKNFSLYTKIDNDYYIVTFISIKSVDGKPAAYVIAYQKDDVIYNHLKWLNYALILGLIFIPFLVGLILMYMRKNKKTKEQNLELKNSEKKLKTSEENFRTFFETIDDMIFIGSQSGEIFFTNSAVRRKLGYTAEELIGMHILDVHPQDKRKEAEKIFTDMFAGDIDYCPLPLARKDGTLLPVETRVWFGKWDEKECVFGISKDLSKEKESLETFNKIFNNNSALMAISTIADKKFTEVNQALLNKLGYKKEEIIGKTALELGLFVEPEKQKKVKEELFKTGKIKNLELKIKTKSGEIMDGLFSGEVIESQGNKYFLTVMIDITEQKRAEEELKVQNGLINSLLDSIPDIIFFKDKEGVYLGCNPPFVEFVGKYKSEIVGKTDYDLFDKETADSFRKYDVKMLAILKSKHNEEWITYSDGRKKLLDTLKTPYWGKDGELIGILGISRDITKRKEAEEKLRKSEELLKMTFDVTGEGIWDWDIKENTVNHNKRWCTILGLDESKLSHSIEFFGNCLYWEDREEVMKKVTEAIISGKPYESEHRMTDINGKVVWVHDRGAVVERNEAGEAVRMIGSIADITERKESEKELKNTTERLSLATRAGEIGIWDYDIVNNILNWDEQMFKLYGITKETFSGAFETWQKGLHSEDLERGSKEVEMAIKGEKEFDTEFRVVWPDGKTVRNIRAIAIVVRDSEGNPMHMVGTNWDITDRKQIESRLLAAKEQAESANRAKSEFLANMSHEIRTPMNAILGFSEILEEEISDRKSLNYLNGIKIAGKNLLNLINDILDLSKIESGKMEIQFEKTNINTVLCEITELFKIKAKEKGIKFYCENDEKIPSVIMIDEMRVKQILINLIGNALKFTEKGFVKISTELLKVDSLNLKADISINVSDSGIGIAKGQKEKIFESFTQQDGQSTRKYGGTGLGLAISKKLANIMGGEITVDETVTKGSKFSLILKNITYFQEKEEEKTGKISINKDENIDYEFNSAIILIAEDIEVNVAVVKGMLKKYNFKILVAENGLDAVNKAKEYHPDIILMDIQMPIMNGYEATEIIKSDNAAKDIKVIALTASAMIEHEQRIKKMCDGYLKKPVKKVELLQELAKYIGNKVIIKEREAGIVISLSNEVRKVLREKYYQEWQNIEKYILGNEVEEFAKKLKITAEEYSSKEIYEYAEKLLNYAAEFDIEKMEQQFRLFEKIINEV